MKFNGTAHFCSCLERALRTSSMDLQLGSSSFFRDMEYISAGLEEPCHTLECVFSVDPTWHNIVYVLKKMYIQILHKNNCVVLQVTPELCMICYYTWKSNVSDLTSKKLNYYFWRFNKLLELQ